ncbi:unnamed protein product [Symbiodinium microadriaticum]|nr:unnamed protein product [Symbiodinium microadriaticum]
MGAGASSLPSKLSQDDIIKIAMDLYNSFKDSDGLVDKELLIRAAMSGQEKEVYDLFKQFSQDGQMNSNCFYKFCRNAKLLSKKIFTVADCVVIFEKSRNTVSVEQGKSVHSINYSTFRKLLLPDIAVKKEIHLDNLIFKLSRVDLNPPLLLHAPSVDIDIDGVIEVDEVGDDDTDSCHERPSPLRQSYTNRVAEQEGGGTGSPVEYTAARRIQSCSRMRIASRRVMELKQIENEASVIKESDFDKPVDGSDTETVIQRYFSRMCRTGEMDLYQCVKMCREADIVDKRFTAVDVELCFIKAKLKASSKDCPMYNSGVIHGKRITYLVFREVLLRCLSEKKGVAIESITHHLINAEACLPAPPIQLHSLASAVVVTS